MSYVSNVILLTFIEDQGIKDVQLWLSRAGAGSLKQIDGFSGGTKAVEHEIWAGAYNWLDIPEFIKAVKSASWMYPSDVQLLIKEEGDDLFSLRAGTMPVAS
jgi:hypothetical protein